MFLANTAYFCIILSCFQNGTPCSVLLDLRFFRPCIAGCCFSDGSMLHHHIHTVSQRKIMIQVQASQFAVFALSQCPIMLFNWLFSCGVGVDFFVCDAGRIYGLAMSWMQCCFEPRYLLAVVQVTRMRCATNVVWQTSFQALLYPLNFTITVPWSVAFWSVATTPSWTGLTLLQQTQLVGFLAKVLHRTQMVLNMLGFVFFDFNGRLQVFPTWFIHKSYFKDLSG